MITQANLVSAVIRKKGRRNVCRSVRFALACDHDRNARNTALSCYLLHSFGLYTIAKRMGKKDAWMAFVPFARTYYHGNMAGPIRLKNTTIKNPGLWKLLFPIIYSGAIGIYVLVLVFGIGMTLAGSAVNQNVTGG